MRSLRIPALLLALTFTAAPALAEDWSVLKDTSVHSSRPQTLDVNLILDPGIVGYFGFGVAGWYGYPVMPDGFVPAINDALYIEAGAALKRESWSALGCDAHQWSLTPMGGVRWEAYLTKEWTAFALAKLGYGMGFGAGASCGGVSWTGSSSSEFKWDFGVGAFYKMSDTWTFRMEIGAFGLQGGVEVPGMTH